MSLDKIEIGTYLNNENKRIKIVAHIEDGDYYVGEDELGHIYRYSKFGKAEYKSVSHDLKRKIKITSFDLYLNLYSNGMYDFFEYKDDSLNGELEYCIDDIKLLERIHIKKEFEI